MLPEKPVSIPLEIVENGLVNSTIEQKPEQLKTVQNNKRVHGTPLVQQATNSFIEQELEQFSEQFLEQKLEQVKTVTEIDKKTILTTPQEDVEKWKHRTKIYFKRSIKKTSKEETKKANKDRYLEYKELLETTGKFIVKEYSNRIEITKK